MRLSRNTYGSITPKLIQVLGLLIGFGTFTPVQAQFAPTMDRRPQATRAQLESTLVDIDKVLASPVYTDEVKRQRRAEATMIQDRLRDGDFQVGDQLQVTLSVPVSPTAKPIDGPYTVGPNQMLQLPDLPEIPLRGVLRSEVKDYLTEYLRRLFKDQVVLVTPTIRLTILGGVSKPGFYQLPADTPLPDAISAAGGLNDATKLDETVIRRGKEELWSKQQLAKEITAGTTLDQLNLRAGDELVVGEDIKKDWWKTLRTYMLIPGLILSLAALGRLLGII